MTKSQSRVPPENMLMTHDEKWIGVYHEIEGLPDNPDLMYKTCMFDKLVPGEGLEITIEPGYDLVVLEGYGRDCLRSLLNWVRHNSMLIWNDLELFIIGVGYKPMINVDVPEDQLIVVMATCELEDEDDRCPGH